MAQQLQLEDKGRTPHDETPRNGQATKQGVGGDCVADEGPRAVRGPDKEKALSQGGNRGQGKAFNQPQRLGNIPMTISTVAEQVNDFAPMAANFRQQANQAVLLELATKLGVSVEALTDLHVGRNGTAWTFPERDADGQIIGIVMRTSSGEKTSKKGSKRGLTMAWPLADYAGASVDAPVVVVEGGSDTAAGLSLGLPTIGRPSATGGVELLKSLLLGRHAAIIGENDQAGRTGAGKVADALVDVCPSVRVAYPPEGVKDLRSWLRSGGTREDVLAAIDATGDLVQEQAASIVERVEGIPLAENFLNANLDGMGQPLLRRWRGDWYLFRGSRYSPATDEAVGAAIWRHLETLQTLKKASIVPVKVSQHLVNEVKAALPSRGIFIDDQVEAPLWLDGRNEPNPLDCVSCSNGLLELPAGKLHQHGPEYFSLNGVDYDYDPNAPEPETWLRFLNDLWPDDPASIFTLQQWMGYCLTPDTRHQKSLLLVGPKRSGKGTIARIMSAVLGPANVCAPTLAGLASNFGLSALMGKLLAIISDARLSTRTDQVIVAERVLSITGEDPITIDRKHRDPITVKFPTRIMLLSNELPRVNDSSGAFASRFVILKMERSWYGNEDPNLADKILENRAGILNWAIQGHRDLVEAGRFVQPETGADVVRELEDLGSPVGAFVDERCQVGPGHQVPATTLWQDWSLWCEGQSCDRGNMQTFARDLRAVVPGLQVTQRRIDGARPRVYQGVTLSRGVTRV